MKEDTFIVCGIVTIDNTSKVRWADNLERRKKEFAKKNATRCDLVELPHPMSKIDALDYISNLSCFSSEEDQQIIQTAKISRTIRKQKVDGTYVPKKRGRPATKPKIVKIKTAKMVDEILKAAEIIQ